MLVTDGKGTPLAEHIESASPAEVTLLERTLSKVAVSCAGRPGRPRCRMPRLLADAGYDSDPLRERLRRLGIELIAPHRSNRVKPPTLDGRTRRRLKRRWVIERTNAWLQTFRRILTRFDHTDVSYAAFVHLGCALLTLNRLLKGL
jgi:transposase